MGSDKRLHPVSILFTLGSTARAFLFPGLAVLFASRSGDWGWQVGAMVMFIPYAAIALSRALSFRYRLEDHELVIRSGIIFRSVRHVPYTRIHNLDAVQNPLHRLLGVTEVRVETGGGAEPEAALQVLSLSAFDEMRQHVLARRAPVTTAEIATGTSEPAAPAGEVVLRLSLRELLLSGFIHSRAAIVIGAAFGALWEFRLGETMLERVFGDAIPGRGTVRAIVTTVSGNAEIPLAMIGFTMAGFVVLVLALRVLSMFWAAVALYGYTLTQQGDDLRAEFGLLTRVTATTPLKRAQTLTVRDGPMHRLFDRVTVRVQTVGKPAAEGQERPRRDTLAPLLRRGELRAFVQRVLPGINAVDMSWRAPHPRAFRRTFIQSSVTAVLLTAALIYPLGAWWLGLLPFVLGWAVLHARLSIRHLGWATTEEAVFFKSGWLWRQMTIVRYARVQAVSLRESPFDRRHGMASLKVDTLGASGSPHIVDIPFIGRDDAGELFQFLYGRAAETRFTV